jgi:hypothetical protein
MISRDTGVRVCSIANFAGGKATPDRRANMGYFFKKANRPTGWAVGVITEDQRPVVAYDCQSCHTQTYFDLTGNGAVPVARCCVRAEKFPPAHYDHLKLKPRWAAEPMEGAAVHPRMGVAELLHKLRAISRGDFFAR